MKQGEQNGIAAPQPAASLDTLLESASTHRKRFVGTLTVLSLGLYFGLLVSVLYLPDVMGAQAIGSITCGVLVVFAQLVVAGATFWVYCLWANRYDDLAKHLADAAEATLIHGHG